MSHLYCHCLECKPAEKRIAESAGIRECLWGNEPGIQLWISEDGPCTKLQIVKISDGNEVLAAVTLAPHWANRLAELLPKIVEAQESKGEAGKTLDGLRKIATEKYHKAKGMPVESVEFKEFIQARREYAREHLLKLYPEIIQEEREAQSSVWAAVDEAIKQLQDDAENCCQPGTNDGDGFRGICPRCNSRWRIADRLRAARGGK